MMASADDALEEGSIQRGIVSRIEPYGAFVELQGGKQSRGLRGLVHISQIANYRLEKVEDALQVNDEVCVKVLEITREQSNYGTRMKLRLSIKDVTQDGTMRDLGAEQASKEALKDQLASNLNSSIGMGIALDPMAKPTSRNSNIVLKSSAAKSQLINGYALVGDDEGEPPPPPRAQVAVVPSTATVRPPVGRGRGTNLPAWMTHPIQREEPSSKNRHDKKKKKKNEKKKKHRKHTRSKHEKKKRKRKRYDSDSYSSSDSDDESDSKRKKERKRKRYDYDSSSSSSNDDDDARSTKRDAMPFHSVEEAKRLIVKLEKSGKEPGTV